MKEYIVSNSDILAINILIEQGGSFASITQDAVNFECGILSKTGYFPIVYGSGDTIVDAINEAIGSNITHDKASISKNKVDIAMKFLRSHGISAEYGK